MGLIVAACLLGLISNLSTILSNNSTQTHDLFRLYMIRSKQLFLNNWLWAWNIYLFESNASLYFSSLHLHLSDAFIQSDLPLRC